MKNTYSLQERNRIVEEHLWCIECVIQENSNLLRSVRVEYDDLYQQLALRLIEAVSGFDPEKGKLLTHIFAQLRHELLDWPPVLQARKGRTISLEAYLSKERDLEGSALVA